MNRHKRNSHQMRLLRCFENKTPRNDLWKVWTGFRLGKRLSRIVLFALHPAVSMPRIFCQALEAESPNLDDPRSLAKAIAACTPRNWRRTCVHRVRHSSQNGRGFPCQLRKKDALQTRSQTPPEEKTDSCCFNLLPTVLCLNMLRSATAQKGPTSHFNCDWGASM